MEMPLDLIRRSVIRTKISYGQAPTHDDVDDLVQEIVLKLWRYRGEVATPRAFVARVARNLTVEKLRRALAQKRGAGRLVPLGNAAQAASASASPEETYLARETLCGWLGSCRAALPQSLWHPFVLVHVKGLSSKEAGERLAISASAVDSAAFRARARLAANGLAVPARRPGAGGGRDAHS